MHKTDRDYTLPTTFLSIPVRKTHFQVRKAELDLPIQAPRSHQSRVQSVRSIGGHEHFDVASWVETIQLVDKLKHGPLDLIVPPSPIIKTSTWEKDFIFSFFAKRPVRNKALLLSGRLMTKTSFTSDLHRSNVSKITSSLVNNTLGNLKDSVLPERFLTLRNVVVFGHKYSKIMDL